MTEESREVIKDVRCPVGFGRLFAKFKLSEETMHIKNNSMFEFSCSDCTRAVRKSGQEVIRILHIFDFTGEFVRTEIVR